MASYFVSSASGAGGAGNGSSWANAYLTMAACIARPTVAGDTIWVGDNHAENQAASYAWTFPGAVTSAPYFIACVDHNIASPALADLKVGVPGAGSFISTGSTNIAVNGNFYMYGLCFVIGSGATGTSLLFNNTAGQAEVFERCYIGFGTTAPSLSINMNNTGSVARCIDCTFRFAAASQNITLRNVRWLRCNIDTAAGVQATIPFLTNTGRNIVEACDLSNLTLTSLISTTTGTGYNLLKRCKLPFSAPLYSTNTGGNGDGFLSEIVQCDNASAVHRNERATNAGMVTTSTAAARTGGAMDNATLISWKMVTMAATVWQNHLNSSPIAVWNDNVATPVSITVEGVADPRDFSALPKNDEVWIDAEYFGNAASTRSVILSGTKSNPLATGVALTASTRAWDAGGVGDRNNSQVYTLGTLFKVSNNPGRLFVITTAGTTAASDAAYASVVDGQTNIVDNTVRAAAFWRFKQTITTSAAPTYAGYIYVTAKVGKGSVLNGVYIDPLVALS